MIDSAPLYYILCPSYHGASTLAWRMNLHPDILSLGTGNPLRGEDQPVSDGSTVSTSQFWKNITETLREKEDESLEMPFETLLPQSPFVASNPRLNMWINSAVAMLANETSPKAWRLIFEQANRFIGMHDKFLRAVREWVPHKAMLDAERSNLKFMVMASSGFPAKGVIHIVRDPRGYVAAWKKYYPESTVEKLTLEWVAAHTRIFRLATSFNKMPFLTLRYEDMMEKPQETYFQVARFMGFKEELTLGGSPGPGKNNLLGVSAQDQLLEPVENARNWAEILTPEEEARILKVVGPLFSEFGYKSENMP